MSNINFKLFTSEAEEVSDEFIHFHEVKTNIAQCLALPDEPLYMRVNEASDRKVEIVYYLTNSKYVQKNPKKKNAGDSSPISNAYTDQLTINSQKTINKEELPAIQTHASFYTDFSYTNGLYHLLKDPQNNKNYQLVLTTEEYQPSKKLTNKKKTKTGSSTEPIGFYLIINLYIRRIYLNQLYYLDHLPTVIEQILQTESLNKKGRYRYISNSRKDLELLPVELTPVNTIWENEESLQQLMSTGFRRLPYPYQMNNIRWMCDLEDKISSGLAQRQTGILNLVRQDDQFVQKLVADRRAYYDENSIEIPSDLEFQAELDRYTFSEDKITMFDVPSIDSYLLCSGNKLIKEEKLTQVKIKLRGGVLSDQIGLGKTFSMIGLIYQQKLIHRQKNDGSCEQNRASLVFCPRRLCFQWQEEIEKTAPLTSYICSTIVQLRKLTEKKIQELDIVICPYSMLVNENFQSHCQKILFEQTNQSNTTSSAKKTPTRKTAAQKTEVVDAAIATMNTKKKKKPIDTSPMIDLLSYQWTRVILDEGHEYLHPSKKMKIKETTKQLMKIHSDYRWICSGTPFANWSGLWDIFRYLTEVMFDDPLVTHKQRTDGFDLYTGPASFSRPGLFSYRYPNWKSTFSCENYFHLYDWLRSELFLYNNYESVANQVSIPPPKIETEFLTQTAIERNIYESALGDTNKMFELCNHILVSEEHVNILGHQPLPLDEIHRKMTNYYQRKKIRLAKRIENLEKKMGLDQIDGEPIATNEDEESEWDDPDSSIPTDFGYEMNPDSELHKELIDKQQATTSRLTIFQSLEERSQEFIQCPVCLETIDDQSFKVITNCGHFFCSICIKEIFHQSKSKQSNQKTHQCPICREAITETDLEVIQGEHNEKNQDINKWGTKMARTINYLTEILTASKHNRVIVFSQWDTLLRYVHQVLNQVNIPHLILNGTVYQVNSKIHQFKLDKNIRVVLLSSEKAASGLTLTEANHILLLDTLNIAAESAQLLEEQAIGRAVRLGQKEQVRVRRLIMKNTIEEKYFLKYRQTNQIDKLIY